MAHPDTPPARAGAAPATILGRGSAGERGGSGGSLAVVAESDLDMVNLKQLAERLGVAYITARKWYANGRPEGILPEPDIIAISRYPYWQWSRIVEWCYETGRERYVEGKD